MIRRGLEVLDALCVLFMRGGRGMDAITQMISLLRCLGDLRSRNRSNVYVESFREGYHRLRDFFSPSCSTSSVSRLDKNPTLYGSFLS